MTNITDLDFEAFIEKYKIRDAVFMFKFSEHRNTPGATEILIQAIIKAFTDTEDAENLAKTIHDHTKQRVQELESFILTNPLQAASYAINVLNDRWPEAESIIKTNPVANEAYFNHISYINEY